MKRLLFVFVAIGSTCLADESRSPDLDVQAEEAFQWLDGLSFPDVTDQPFVEINAEKNLSVYGFVIASSSDGFTLFTLDLNYRQCSDESFRVRSLSRFAANCLEHVRPASGEARDHYLFSAPCGLKHANLDSDLTQKTLLTVLAWACRKNGVVYKPLIARASELAHSRYLRYSPDSLLKCIKDDIACNLGVRIAWDFGDRRIPLQSVAKEIQWCLRTFPDHPMYKQWDLSEQLEILNRMIVEDKTHDYSKPLRSMSEAEQMAELVYRLRHQNGRGQSNPPMLIDVLNDPRGDEAPAGKLIAFGLRAVPHLFAEVQNDTLTRSVARINDSRIAGVHTVGNVVQAIIDTVTEDALRAADVDDKTRGEFLKAFYDLVDEDTDEPARTRKLHVWWQEVKANL